VARSFSRPGQLIDGKGPVSAMFECLIQKDPSVICDVTSGSTLTSYFIVPRQELVVVTKVWIWRSNPPRDDNMALRVHAFDEFSICLNFFFLLMWVIVCWILESVLSVYLSSGS
jgi:hypothetical protein